MTKLSPPSVTLTVAEPDVVGPLAVFPLFGPAAALDVRLLRGGVRARRRDARARRAARRSTTCWRSTRSTCPSCSTRARRSAARSRTARSTSPCSSPARSRTRVPVSCVEHGRWDGTPPRRAVLRRRPQAAYPALRRLKNEARAPLPPAAPCAQDEVWDEVADKSGAARRRGRHRRAARRLRAPPRRARRVGRARSPGATGSSARSRASAGSFAVLDCVGRADVFAALARPARRGLRARRDRARHGRAPARAAVDRGRGRLHRVRPRRAAPPPPGGRARRGRPLRLARRVRRGAGGRRRARRAHRVPGRAGEGADEPSVASVTLTPCGSPPASTTRCCSQAGITARRCARARASRTCRTCSP